MDIRTYLSQKREFVDDALERYFPKSIESQTTLHKAMRYSLFAGGKRIRPILSIAAFEAMGAKGDNILPFACGLEMIHTYSLIHDDLPAVDNDDYRRGKLTCHKVFGEAIAILAGDALLTEAFQLMTQHPLHASGAGEEGLILELVNEVARAAGLSGMVVGQVVDIESEGKEIDLPTLEYLHTHKTGKMILAAIKVGAKLGGANGDALQALTAYGERIGLAFQIADDILNVEGKPDILGKNTGTDVTRKKATYPGVLGLQESKCRGAELVERAIDALSRFGPKADPLREIARFIVAREH
jgi:geranylgeranyl diphosphate synthase, type II